MRLWPQRRRRWPWPWLADRRAVERRYHEALRCQCSDLFALMDYTGWHVWMVAKDHETRLAILLEHQLFG